ncbi:MAG: hypothetical protein OER21_13110, partial [Gemmatimonadota bacterium]|nr:hypothetical protein [Gemmatimonadota bacterium]
MTTRTWLERQTRAARRRVGAAGFLVLVGAVAGAWAVGVLAGRSGLYRALPELALGVWLGALALAGAVVWRWARRLRALSAARVGAEVERRTGLRHGALAGLAGPAHGSDALAALADRRMTAWLDGHGADAATAARRSRAGDVREGALTAGAGLVLLLAAGGLASNDFWRPVALVREARGPVQLTADRLAVRRGDTVTVTVRAPGRPTARIAVRAPGESWRDTALLLDASGHAALPLGPLDSDRYVYAASGTRRSDTLHIEVHAPAFLAEATLEARYPGYLHRAAEPLPLGGDTVLLPVGTRVVLRGRASQPIARAAWAIGTDTVALAVDGPAVAGAVGVTRSATWVLGLWAPDGALLEELPRPLVVRAVPDAAPMVRLPVPGADTTVPPSLQQALVMDVRDDYRVMRVDVLSRRASRLGTQGPVVTERVALPADGVERAILSWTLDLSGRGFLPGDTAFVRVRVWDNAPRPQAGETREFALRLPSLGELRDAARREVRALAAAADTLVREQRDLGRATEDLARARDRDGATPAGGRGDERVPFRTAERAGELGAAQRRALERARDLRERLSALERTAWEAGLTDPAWQQQLADLRRLLEQAMTPELARALRELEEALQRLDAAAVRNALQQLAQAQEALRRELERSRDLFERAAVEGELTTRAADAAELAERQREWVQAAAQAVDSMLARREDGLAAAADSLAAALAALETAAARVGDSGAVARAGAEAGKAADQMRTAAGAAAAENQRRAVAAGTAAADQLAPLAASLEQARDQLRDTWRAEVLDALNRALVETAQLARQQEAVARRLSTGEAGPDVRGAQAAARGGVDRVLERLQKASAKNALVSPRLGAALGYARAKMDAALEQLQQGMPNPQLAGTEAGDALDGLNALAMRLLRAQSDVAGAESGSGLAEAMQRMAELAQRQGAMAG